jgi:hypothetical protein
MVFKEYLCIVYRVSVKMATSLANTTSTRADSSSRHMLQCRVHRDRLLSWTDTKCNNNELQRNKHRYSLTKDELALDVTSQMDPHSDQYSRRSQPYPMVLSSFHGLCTKANDVYACLMHTDTPFHNSRHELFQKLKSRSFKESEDGELDASDHSQVKTLPYFRTMGYSVGTAYAHENTGDTIASVMIGGIVTVLNGAFPLQTGDRVMWYLAKAEADMFDVDGGRILAKRTPNPMRDGNEFNHKEVTEFVESIRQSSKQARQGGVAGKNKVAFMKNVNGFELAGNEAKSEIALIKPFHYRNASDGDIERVFAVCISPAAPFEMVDIMISRQSL